MIKFFRSWCEGIIVAVVISIIIETILPDGNNKKYIKVISGIYLIFTILNPFLGKLNNIDFGKIDIPTIQTSSNLDNTKDVRQIYLDGICETLKNSIEEKFDYEISNLEINYDEKYENIEKINIKLKKNNIKQIEKVEIGNNTEKHTEENYEILINYLTQNYNVSPEKIIIM